MRYCILLAVVCATLFNGSLGFSKGAPKEVCENMTPNHPGTPQTRNSMPYNIKLSKGKIRSGENVEVTISGKNGEPIKGFMIQARVGDTPVGHFSASKDAQTLDCGSGKRTTATHKNSNVKKEVKVTWTAPTNLKETVHMHATVVQDGATYWVNHKSRSLVVS